MQGQDGKFLIVGSSIQCPHTSDCYQTSVDRKHKKIFVDAGNGRENPVDISWLPFAAETYRISDDPRNYLFVPVPIVTVAIPNKNLQAFTFGEVTRHDSIQGRQVYKTFLRKPTHIDHNNRDPRAAKGAIFDSTLQYVDDYDIWKIVTLLAFDRTKDEELWDQINRKERTAYSMAALVDYFQCSVCSHKESKRSGICACMKNPGKGGVIDDELVYQLCIGTNYIEGSSVDDPADVTADAPDLLWVSN